MARRRPSTPGIDGILLVDKANGPTSHDVVAKVRRISGQPRIGHGGTLDPFATGLLVLVLGRATRLAALHLGGAKRYEATFSFGGATTTDDLDGELIRGATARVTREHVESLLPKFRGALEQIPPSHSAKRTDGVRAYERARAGETVTLAPRSIEITRFEMSAWDESQPDEPLMGARLDVSSGTYIRAVARDLGAAVGSGAHLVALRRIGSGAFDVAQAHSMTAIAEAALAGRLSEMLLPLDAGIETIPRIDLNGAATRLLQDGALISAHLCGPSIENIPMGDQVRLMVANNLAALGRRTDAGVQPERVFITPNATSPGRRHSVEAG
ncbi:MAG: tRNA pseudouridine(55) synthase TruB [Candidatus Limnocylindrus sp.]